MQDNNLHAVRVIAVSNNIFAIFTLCLNDLIYPPFNKGMCENDKQPGLLSDRMKLFGQRDQYVILSFHLLLLDKAIRGAFYVAA